MAVTKKTAAKKPKHLKQRQGPPLEVLQAIGARLREVRIAKGFSQERLALAVPLNKAHVGLIENGHKAITAVTLVRLANTLGVEVGELFPPIKKLGPLLPLKDPFEQLTRRIRPAG
jgi:transcriptional regulator with XRE-family HTH domain